MPEVMSSEIRRTIVTTAAESGESAHIGGSLSMVEMLNCLFGDFMRHDPKVPTWSERDIFILSKGHAVLGYLAVLHLYGYFDTEKLATFQKDGSDLIAHPVKNLELGIESSNGSLGQGLSYGLGIALGMIKRQETRRVFVMLGDGECNEGSVWEAAALAAELRLGNLIALVDNNQFRNDGATTTYGCGKQLQDIWRAFGWQVFDVDGHCEVEIGAALSKTLTSSQPSVIIGNTIKGKGFEIMEGNNDWHHNRITPSILEALGDELKVG